ncbi:hypothetical protein MHYP_G00052680 [Metynnis hypsauchen]
MQRELRVHYASHPGTSFSLFCAGSGLLSEMSSSAGHLVDKGLEREKVTSPRKDKTNPKRGGAREAVRKQVFTRWINSRLKRCDPPLQVDDLFTDVQDGKILMALIEELSGCKMLDRFRPSTHHIFTLSNIAKVLEFLEDRNVSVVNIDAPDIAEGRPSVILALIWNIIVYFQLKEVTGNLERRFSSSVPSLVSLTDSSDSARSSPAPPSEDPCTLPSKRRRTSGWPKYYRSRSISTLLSWTQTCTAQYGVEVHDFGKSWRSGLAFLALVKSARPELVDMKAALTSSPRENITQAFREAQHGLGVPPLLEPEDVMMRSPDEQSIITYVTQFLQHFPESRDVHVSALSLEEYNPSGVYRYSSLSCSSLVEPDFSSQQFDISSSYGSPKSAGVLNGGSAVAEKSRFSNGQFLHSSIEGHCWSSSAQKISLSVSMEDDDDDDDDDDDGGLSGGSEEGINILPELDSDEEDAYKYILELDHEEFKLHNELKSSPTINSQKAHHISSDFHQADDERHHLDGKSHHLGPFLEIQKQSYQPWSEGCKETSEEHSNLCALNNDLNINTSHDNKTYKDKYHNSDRNEGFESRVCERDKSLDKVSTSSREGGLHSVISNDSIDNQSLSEVKSLRENGLTKEDILCEINSQEAEDNPQPGNFMQETDFSFIVEEPQMTATSETGKDLSFTVLEDTINSETEVLHTVLMLWILTYCIFMLRQLEIWVLF